VRSALDVSSVLIDVVEQLRRSVYIPVTGPEPTVQPALGSLSLARVISGLERPTLSLLRSVHLLFWQLPVGPLPRQSLGACDSHVETLEQAFERRRQVCDRLSPK